MKVHQTLVWLNLLSLGTKGLTKPTIGIQSGLCHGRGLARTASQQHSLTTLIRHFVSIKPAYTVPPSCLSQQYCVSVVRELKTCRPGRYVSAWGGGGESLPLWACLPSETGFCPPPAQPELRIPAVLPGGRGHRQITQNRPYKKIICG